MDVPVNCTYKATRFRCSHQIASRDIRAVTHSSSCAAASQKDPNFRCYSGSVVITNYVKHQCWYCDENSWRRSIPVSELSWWNNDLLRVKIIDEKVNPYLPQCFKSGSSMCAHPRVREQTVSVIFYNTFKSFQENKHPAFTAMDKIFKDSVEEFLAKGVFKIADSQEKQGDTFKAKNIDDTQSSTRSSLQEMTSEKSSPVAARTTNLEETRETCKALMAPRPLNSAREPSTQEHLVQLKNGKDEEIAKTFNDALMASRTRTSVTEPSAQEHLKRSKNEKDEEIARTFKQALMASRLRTLSRELREKNKPATEEILADKLIAKKHPTENSSMSTHTAARLAKIKIEQEHGGKLIALRAWANTAKAGMTPADRALSDKMFAEKIIADKASLDKGRAHTEMTLVKALEKKERVEKRISDKMEADNLAAVIESMEDLQWEKIGVAGTSGEEIFDEDWTLL